MSGFVGAAASGMSSRPGGALLVALALLAMGAALLAGSFAAGTAAQRSVQSREAALLAGTEARAAIAEFVSGWGGAEDSLAVGAERFLVLGPRPRDSGAVSMITQLHLRRLSATRYVLVADCQAGLDDAVLARRRVRAILDRGQAVDSMAPAPAPAPTRRWSLADLY